MRMKIRDQRPKKEERERERESEIKATTWTESKTELHDIDGCLSTLSDSLIKPINLYAEEVSNVNRPNQVGQNGFVRNLWK